MNKSIVLNGRILMLLGLMLAPLTVSFIYREAPVYKISQGHRGIVPAAVVLKKPASTRFYTRRAGDLLADLGADEPRRRCPAVKRRVPP